MTEHQSEQQRKQQQKKSLPARSSMYTTTHTPPRWIVSQAIEERISQDGQYTLKDNYNSPKFRKAIKVEDCQHPNIPTKLLLRRRPPSPKLGAMQGEEEEGTEEIVAYIEANAEAETGVHEELSAAQLAQEYIRQGVGLLLKAHSFSSSSQTGQDKRPPANADKDASEAVMELLSFVEEGPNTEMEADTHSNDLHDATDAEMEALLDRATTFISSYYAKGGGQAHGQVETGRVKGLKPSSQSTLPTYAHGDALHTSLLRMTQVVQAAHAGYERYQLPPFAESNGPNIHRYAVSRAQELVRPKAGKMEGIKTLLQSNPVLEATLRRSLSGSVLQMPPGRVTVSQATGWPTDSLRKSADIFSAKQAATASVPAATATAKELRAKIVKDAAFNAEQTQQSAAYTAYKSFLQPHMARLDCVLCVTHCCWCKGHTTLRHKQDKYHRTAMDTLRWLGKSCVQYRPAARIGLLRIPRDANLGDIDKDNSFASNLHTFRRDTSSSKTSNQACCTSLGAFEVQVSFLDEKGVFHSSILHSKVRQQSWPQKKLLRERLFEFFDEHTSRLLPWDADTAQTKGHAEEKEEKGNEEEKNIVTTAHATNHTSHDMDLASNLTPVKFASPSRKSTANISVPFCANPDKCSRGCRNSANHTKGAVVLSEEESLSHLNQSMTDLARLAVSDVPNSVTHVVDYSFESSLHFFSVGDVVDVKQVAPLILSPRRCHQHHRHNTKTASTHVPTKSSASFLLAAQGLYTDTVFETLNSAGMGRKKPTHSVDETFRTSGGQHINMNGNGRRGRPRSPNQRESSSPQRLRRSVHETRAIVPLGTGKNLFSDGLCNRVPFHSGAAHRDGGSITAAAGQTMNFLLNGQLLSGHSRAEADGAIAVASAVTVPALIPTGKPDRSLTRPCFRVGPSLSTLAVVAGHEEDHYYSPQQSHTRTRKLWYNQGFLRGLITSAHRDGTYDIAYLPDCGNVRIKSEVNSKPVRAYVPDSCPEYMSLSDRRKAGFVDSGVPQEFVTTCRNLNSENEMISHLSTSLPSTTGLRVEAKADVEVVGARQRDRQAYRHIAYRYQVVFHDASLAKETRPWRRKTNTANNVTASGTDVYAILQQVFEDEGEDNDNEQDNAEDRIFTPMEEAAYDTLEIPSFFSEYAPASTSGLVEDTYTSVEVEEGSGEKEYPITVLTLKNNQSRYTNK